MSPLSYVNARFWYEYGKINVMSSFFQPSAEETLRRQKRIIERL